MNFCLKPIGRNSGRPQKKNIKPVYVEFGRMKESLFNRYCTSQSVNGEYAKLKQLLLSEEYKIVFPMVTICTHHYCKHMQGIHDVRVLGYRIERVE